MSLNLKTLMKEDQENKKMSEQLKYSHPNPDIEVSQFEESLRESIVIADGDQERWKKEFEQRKEEWVKEIREDAELEEGYNVLVDMIQ